MALLPQHLANSFSLYVGDLDPMINEYQLEQTIRAKLTGNERFEIALRRDYYNPSLSRGYAIVTFNSHDTAKKFLDDNNYTMIGDKPIRLMWSQPNPSMRKRPSMNVCVKNLPPGYTTKQLHELFAQIGTIDSCKVPQYLHSTGPTHGFVQFFTRDDAEKAIAEKNGSEVDGCKIVVEFAHADDAYVHRNCFMSNIDPSITEEEISDFVSGKVEFKVKQVRLCRKRDAASYRVAIIYLESEENAKDCARLLNGEKLKDSNVSVSIARSKKERMDFKRKQIMETRWKNLYFQGFPEHKTEEELQALFAPYGRVVSFKIVRRDDRPTGYGFCCFDKEEDARKAYLDLNGKELDGPQPLLVNYAQTKLERRVQRRRMPHPQMPHHSFYNQPLGPQPMYPEMMAPGMFPMGGAGPSYQQPRGGQRPHGQQGRQMQGRGGGQPQINPVGFGGMMPMAAGPQQMQQQAFPAQMPGMMYPQGQFMGAQGGMPAMYPAQAQPQIQHPPQAQPQPQAQVQPQLQPQAPLPGQVDGQQLPIDQLRQMSPEDQKNAIGEVLYARIHPMDQVSCGKITGMLLELPIDQLLHLMNNQQTLASKVREAQEVLQRAGAT